VSGPAGVSVDATNGVLTWTPGEDQGPSTNTITVRVYDNGSPVLSATNSFVVVVTEVNRAPALAVPGAQTVAEQTLLTVTNTASDPDVPANVLRFGLVSGPAGAATSRYPVPPPTVASSVPLGPKRTIRSWPLAFLLGAIISPPDAVAATGIIKGLGLNKRVITILEGESLVNDASALIAYRYALAAVTTGSFILWEAGLQFFLVAGGGILIGILVGYILVFAHKRVNNNPVVETSLTLLTPFLSYLAAEQVHTSGILAVVSTGLVISWRSPEIFR